MYLHQNDLKINYLHQSNVNFVGTILEQYNLGLFVGSKYF